MSELTRVGSVSPAAAGGAAAVVKRRERREEQSGQQHKRNREDETPDELDADSADLSYEAQLRLSAEHASEGKTTATEASEIDTPGVEQPDREDPSASTSPGPRSRSPKGRLIDERC